MAQGSYLGSSCAMCAEVGLHKTCAGRVCSAFVTAEIQDRTMSEPNKNGPGFLSPVSQPVGMQQRCLGTCAGPLQIQGASLLGLPQWHWLPGDSSLHFPYSWQTLTQPGTIWSGQGDASVTACCFPAPAVAGAACWWQAGCPLQWWSCRWAVPGERWCFMATTTAGAFLREVYTNGKRHKDQCEPKPDVLIWNDGAKKVLQF